MPRPQPSTASGPPVTTQISPQNQQNCFFAQNSQPLLPNPNLTTNNLQPLPPHALSAQKTSVTQLDKPVEKQEKTEVINNERNVADIDYEVDEFYVPEVDQSQNEPSTSAPTTTENAQANTEPPSLESITFEKNTPQGNGKITLRILTSTLSGLKIRNISSS